MQDLVCADTLKTRNGYITARSDIGAFMLIKVPDSFLSFFVFCRRNPGKLIFDLLLKLIQGNDVHEIKLDVFKHPFIGTLADPTLEQQRTDKSQKFVLDG